MAPSTLARISSRAPGSSDPATSMMDAEPTLLVKMTMVLQKSTTVPFESVRRPSSSICSITLNTSGWAFSISSKSTTAYGLRRTASVSWPPSSKPT
jgi:hypothetical protein